MCVRNCVSALRLTEHLSCSNIPNQFLKPKLSPAPSGDIQVKDCCCFWMTWTRFPSKQTRDAYCLTLLRKTAEWAEKVTMLYEISPCGVVKHRVLIWPLLENDGNILYLFQPTFMKVFWVALDCWYAVAGMTLSKKNKKINHKFDN